MKKLLSILLVILTVGCTTGNFLPVTPTATDQSCSQEKINTYLDDYLPMMDIWTDTLDLANATPIISLAPQVEKLQEMKREFVSINPPPCLNTCHYYARKYVEKTIEGLIKHMGGSSDKELSSILQEANWYLEIATSEIYKVKACIPNCE